MDTIESKILALENALAPHRTFWQNEVLDQYFNLELTPEHLNSSLSLSNHEIMSLINDKVLPIHHPWFELNEKLKMLSELSPMVQFSENVQNLSTPINFQRISTKKRHEIDHLLTFTKLRIQPKSQSTALDLAGGVGFLSQQLTHQFMMDTTVVDNNKSFEEKILKRNATKVKFLCTDLLENNNHNFEHFDHCYLLHGCGDLSDQALKLFLTGQNKTLCVLGCCYHLKKQHLSFQHFPINLSKKALYLAAKTYKILNDKLWQKRLVQKNYRYAFEFWFQKIYFKPCPTLKSSSGIFYQNDFLFYAKEQLRRLNIPMTNVVTYQLQKEYEESQTTRTLLINLGVLRSVFSRPLEVYLALRRAQQLKAANLTVEVGEIFHANISPRNIMIFAQR